MRFPGIPQDRFERTARSRPGRTSRLGPLLLFAVVTAVYTPAVFNDFIYDDVQIILGHEAPRGGGDWARIFAERHFPICPTTGR